MGYLLLCCTCTLSLLTLFRLIFLSFHGQEFLGDHHMNELDLETICITYNHVYIYIYTKVAKQELLEIGSCNQRTPRNKWEHGNMIGALRPGMVNPSQSFTTSLVIVLG